MFDKDLVTFLAGDHQAATLHKFKERLPEVKRCRKCHQDIKKKDKSNRSQSQGWRSDDGMTESILSQDEDRERVDLIK